MLFNLFNLLQGSFIILFSFNSFEYDSSASYFVIHIIVNPVSMWVAVVLNKVSCGAVLLIKMFCFILPKIYLNTVLEIKVLSI